jgi:hypothetical protein
VKFLASKKGETTIFPLLFFVVVGFWGIKLDQEKHSGSSTLEKIRSVSVWLF